MRTYRFLSSAVLLRVLTACLAMPLLAAGQARFPTPNPPSEERSAAEIRKRLAEKEAEGAPRAADVSGKTLYNIGDPTDEEQLYVEYINRARADPAAEAQFLRNLDDPDVLSAVNQYDVKFDVLETQFEDFVAMPPYSIHADLTVTARRHTEDQFENTFQGHYSSSASPLPDITYTDSNGDGVISSSERMTFAGYDWGSTGENVFSFADSVLFGHAGFNIDWGNAPDGIQDPPGHRITIHDGKSFRYREIGVGVVLGSKDAVTDFPNEQNMFISSGDVGPQLVTQVFARPLNDTRAFITGVAYYDLDGDGFYSLGEGIEGLTVDVTGSDFYAETASSGGYSVPVDSAATYDVTVSGPGMAPTVSSVTVGNFTYPATDSNPSPVTVLANKKFDIALTYTPPTVTPPAEVVAGSANTLTIGDVPGATGYRVRLTPVVAINVLEDAEDSGVNWTDNTNAEYSFVQSAVAVSGSAFHFATTDTSNDPSAVLNTVLQLTASSELSFQSRLDGAADGQVARFQISEDGSNVWTDLFTQQAPDGGRIDEKSFSLVTADLSAYVGKVVQFRMLYEFVGGGFFDQSTLGWFVDDIAVSNAFEIANATVTDFTGSAPTITPPATGDYFLEVAPLNFDKALPYTTAVQVTAVEGSVEPLELNRVSIHPGDSDDLIIEFEALNADGATLTLEHTDDLNVDFETVPGATPTSLGNDRHEFTQPLPTDGGPDFYRVRGVK